MKKIIVIIALLLAVAAPAQIVPVDTTTNQIIRGVAITGDTLFISFTKLNADVYFVGQLASNNIAALLIVSNTVTLLVPLTANFNEVSNNFESVSNAFITVSNEVVSGLSLTTLNFDAGKITSDGSGDITAVSITAQLWDDDYASGTSGNVPTANGDGTWTWAAATSALPPGMTEYTSDSVLYAQFAGGFQADLLEDSYGNGGSPGAVATTLDGGGTWEWQPLPTTMNYDGGAITSDGSGDITAVSIVAELWDNSDSSGTAGYVPTANGDGTWTWAPDLGLAAGNVVPDSGGNGGTCLHLKASDNGQDMYLHVDSSGAITATTSQ